MTIIQLRSMSTNPTHITIDLTDAHAAVRFRSQVRKNFLCNKTLKFFLKIKILISELMSHNSLTMQYAAGVKSQYEPFCVLFNLDFKSLSIFPFVFVGPSRHLTCISCNAVC